MVQLSAFTVLLGKVCACCCRYQESINVCETVVQLNPLHYAAYSGKGLCHDRLNQVAEAKASFSRALEINPHMPYVQNRLRALFERDHQFDNSGDGI